MSEQGPLADLRVIDASTLFAGPLAAMLLGDFGADVLKIEHPRGDPARTHGMAKRGTPLWWKLIGRNKRAITLYLGAPEGQALFRRLARNADIIVENFRPGTLERWDLGYETLAADNPRLILVRVTAYGQFGPYSKRPGFGTIAEAMSGFASITGQPEGPPTLPPFGLADGITGIAAALAAMMAVHARERTGRGQVVDIALIEPIVTVLGAQAVIFDQLGHVQQRTGNRSVKNAPRNTYKTADGKWVAVSTSSTTIAERVMRIVGWPEAIDEPWFQSARGRFEHVEELDRRVADWVGRHSCAEVIAAFDAAEAAAAPIYDIRDVFADPQFQALETITTVQDEDLGALRMQNVLFRLSRNKGSIRHTGRSLGADNDAVYREELGLTEDEVADLARRGVI
jgi:crotonobetainyl-CoA:carnitine CoA-transferase CaiB-like acyl-CoA transferase